MKPVNVILEERISEILTSIINDGSTYPGIVRASANPKFGDYQANGIMGAAKKNKLNPRELAAKVVEMINLDDICEEPEIAGPGFINLRIKTDFISNALLEISKDTNNLAIEATENPQTVVVDYSGPNIAKEMHVGHLRSTIIGDCICQMLEALGHNVIRQNHIGDWGTQFGMLCALLAQKQKASENVSMALSDLEAFYKEAKALYDSNPEFAKTARGAIAGLHNGDDTWKSYWQQIVAESRKHYTQIYNALSVTLSEKDEYGESAYKDELKGVVDDLKDKQLAVESDGAYCVFPDGFKTKDDTPMPFIVQKSDGAFLYATTDLAAMKYRTGKLDAQRIVYVTDARQMLHFQMLFAVSKMAGFAKAETQLDHVTFGTMLGDDGKPFKTRSGENVKLKDLLAEAVERAYAVVNEKNPQLDEQTKQDIAQSVGIGAVKYSDYSNNRTTDYVFSFEKMLAMEGNTAPYMQYACARVKSIERKAKEKGINIESELAGIDKLDLTETQELDLAMHITKYSQVLESACSDYKPNFVTTYLYELAQKFSAFYTNCPVLSAGDEKRPTRLMLCRLTEMTLSHGLEKILRISVPQQM
ncbi:MAG: arginine--tRNA ligase [Sedimentisphaeraceae bacterium JB056]